MSSLSTTTYVTHAQVGTSSLNGKTYSILGQKDTSVKFNIYGTNVNDVSYFILTNNALGINTRINLNTVNLNVSYGRKDNYMLIHNVRTDYQNSEIEIDGTICTNSVMRTDIVDSSNVQGRHTLKAYDNHNNKLLDT